MFVVFCCLGFVAANRPRKYRAGPTGLDRSKKRSDRLNHLSVCLSFDVCCFTCCVSLLIIVVVRVAVVADDILAILWCFKHQLLLAQILAIVYIYIYVHKEKWLITSGATKMHPPSSATSGHVLKRTDSFNQLHNSQSDKVSVFPSTCGLFRMTTMTATNHNHHSWQWVRHVSKRCLIVTYWWFHTNSTVSFTHPNKWNGFVPLDFHMFEGYQIIISSQNHKQLHWCNGTT